MLALTVILLVDPRVTAPVPRLRLFEPVNVKLAFQFCALLVERVTALPLVLSIVAAFANVKVPVPMADEVPPPPPLLIFRVPAADVAPLLMVVPPE